MLDIGFTWFNMVFDGFILALAALAEWANKRYKLRPAKPARIIVMNWPDLQTSQKSCKNIP